MNPVIEKHIEDFKAACSRLNIPADLPSMPSMSQSVQDHKQADHMLMVFVADKKAGRKPKYGDAMYFPWWYRAYDSGSGFRLFDVCSEHSNATVGAPFESLSHEDAKELADKYQDLYEIKQGTVEF